MLLLRSGGEWRFVWCMFVVWGFVMCGWLGVMQIRQEVRINRLMGFFFFDDYFCVFIEIYFELFVVVVMVFFKFFVDDGLKI